ncbi:hypothetical protein [Miniimonas arenae]|uniref:hypothetical protein n=1 Tax=Miniimonas arenae TaxID=676201 RepID=UPI0028A8D88C|nr:hypothetical protein [Miniimonas arenae]
MTTPPRPLARTTARPTAALVCLLLATTAALTSCTASRQEPGQAVAAVTDAVELADSAVATTTLTVVLLDGGDLVAPVADTAISDQIGELSDASSALTTLVPPDDASSALRVQGLAALATAVDAVVSARAWVASTAGGNLGPDGGVPTDPRDVVDALGEAADQLDAVLAEAGR